MLQKLFAGLLCAGLMLSGSALAETHQNPAKHHKAGHHKSHHKSHHRNKHYKKRKHHIVREAVADDASLFTRGPTVTTSPYIGIRTAYDASDLVVNLPSMNEDLRLLKQQQQLMQRMRALHIPFVERPVIELSGDVVGQVFWSGPSEGNSSHDINLSDARFDIFAHASSWVLAYISFDFDNSRLQDDVVGSGFRVGNSSLFLKRAFLTIGNLDCAPVYFSLGQMYVPFGRYSTSQVTSALTVALGQTNQRAALLGYSQGGLFAQAYAFSGDSDEDLNNEDHTVAINQWGVNAGYKLSNNHYDLEVGAGYIGNIADSTGMQINNFGGTGTFQGFAFSNDTENLDHRVPAYDVHGELSFGNFSFDVEYIAATKSFTTVDLAYNNEGAMPSAFNVDGTYRFQLGACPASFSLGYGFTNQALALNIPEQSLWATFKTSLFKNTIESIEYRYDVNYDAADTSAGLIGFENGLPVSGPGPNGGGHRNTLVAEVGVYF